MTENAENKDTEIKKAVTEESPVKNESIGQPTAEPVKKAAISTDDADDVINPITPVMPDANGKCVYVNLIDVPKIELRGQNNDKPALILKVYNVAKDANGNLSLFLPEPLEDQTTDELAKRAKTAFGNIKHFISALIPGGIPKIEGDTYHEVVDKMVAAIPKESYNNPKLELNLKIMYNKKGYLTLPNYPPFASSIYKNMDFKFSPAYDFLVAPPKETTGSASTAKPETDAAKFNSI